MEVKSLCNPGKGFCACPLTLFLVPGRQKTQRALEEARTEEMYTSHREWRKVAACREGVLHGAQCILARASVATIPRPHCDPETAM